MTADVAHVLNTPLGDLLEMDWQELVLWHKEARRLTGGRGGGGRRRK